jgi:hypothetical protein
MPRASIPVAALVLARASVPRFCSTQSRAVRDAAKAFIDAGLA